jgi:hypothetical protein
MRLSPPGQVVPSAEIEAAAKEAGISERQLKGARQRLGVDSMKIDDGSRWGQRLPSASGS